MEENRSIDFDSDVEMNSLKDAVWRLTTRVYLLEDFIAERFGEILGPRGFTKSPSFPFSATNSSKLETTLENSNVSSSHSRGRKRRKSPTVAAEEKVSGQKTQSNPDGGMVDPLRIDTHPITDLEDLDNDSLLIPKSERIQQDCDAWEEIDDFMSDKYCENPVKPKKCFESQKPHSLKRRRRRSHTDDKIGESLRNECYKPDLNDDDLSEDSGENEDPTDSTKNDPDFLPSSESESYGHNKPLEEEGVRFVKSQRGKDKLEYCGFMYCHVKDLRNGGSHWVCEKRPKCKASLSYSRSKGFEVKKHDHDPDPNRYEILMLMEKMRIEAETTDCIPSSIYGKVMEGASANAVASMHEETCKRLIRKIRSMKAVTTAVATTATQDQLP